MMREELVAGLKNAMERGYSIEQAMQSFVNSGYNQKDVEEASAFLTRGVNSTISQTPNLPVIASSPSANQPINQTHNIQDNNQSVSSSLPMMHAAQYPPQAPPSRPIQHFASTEHPKSKAGIIIAITILIFLIAASILTIIFKDQLISLISK